MKKNQPLNLSRRRLLSGLPMGYAVACGFMLPAIWAPFAKLQAAGQLNLQLQDSPIPDIPLLGDAGDKQALSVWQDRPLLVNFWATWCAPCVTELPMLEEAAQKLAEDNITLILISMDRGGVSVARSFLDERAIITPISLYDPKAELARDIGLRGLPTTLLVKKNQAGYGVHTGPAEWNDEAVLAQVKSYLLS